MPDPIISRCLDDADVARAAAERLVEIAGRAIAARGRMALALAGGSTPKRLYQLLAEPPYRDRVTWDKVEFFFGDERSVPPEHSNSNYGMFMQTLPTKVSIAPARIHRIRGEAADLDAAAREYQNEIARVMQASPDGAPPAFDLVLLGMGDDGHTASLFPFTTALAETTRWVVANKVPQLSTSRVTLTYPTINAASHVVFLVTGAGKAARLAEVLRGPADPQRLPSQRVRPVAGELVWLVDRAAAEQIPDA